MTEALEKNIRKVVPYVPGEQPQNPNVIKLNTNENPYSPAPGVARVLSCKSTGRLLWIIRGAGLCGNWF